MANVESMHYLSTITINVDPIPIECKPIALVPTPHHFGLEVQRAHIPLQEHISCLSMILEAKKIFYRQNTIVIHT